MKKAKKAISLGVVLAIAATMLAIPMNNFLVESATTSTTNLVPKNAEKVPFEIIKLGTNVATLGNNGNVLVSIDSPADDRLPGITRDSSGNIVVAFTTEIGTLEIEMGWGVSSDNGATWTAYGTTAGGVTMYNDIAWVNGPAYYGLFGVYIEPAEEQEGFYLAPDATDFTTWVFYHWTGDAYDPTYACISDNSYLEGQYHDMDGPANMYIEHLIYSTYDIEGCPNQMITCFDPNTGEILGGESTFDGQRDLDTAPAYDPDMSNEYMKSHHTWHYTNPDTGESKIVWKKIIPIEGDTDSTDIEYTPYQQYLDDGKHPNIGHSGNNVVVVYMNNDNIYGDWDIKCAYSSDDGETWETSMIAEDHPVDETYPAVYMSGNTVFCAYIKEGNLYLVKSEDGGATWEDPEQINDEDGTVVEEENAVDIHPAGIVWTDNRNENKDIYFAPIPGARIEVTDISGGFGVSATITNVGTAEATDVGWTITVDATIGGGENTGTIETLSAGGEETVSTGFMFGLGPADITVTANGASATASGFMLGPFVLGVS